MAGARILVVEDERIVARDLQNRLQRFGYTVTGTAASGEEAIEKAAAGHPDLVLMDVMLAGKMDGTEAAEQVRDRFQIPVVYLTAYADSGTLQRAKLTEPFGYVIKPFEENTLRMTIELALYKHQAELALRRTRDELEIRVEERTADLRAANERLRREIEEHRQTEEALRRSEMQLIQAQKMEAIGRLAGGVAHDFNNKLAIIRGYTEIAMDEIPEGSRTHEDLKEALDTLKHASDLTEQLLLFSSQRPPNRRPVSLNQQVRNLDKMLGRLLGEDVRVGLRLAEGLWTVRADSVNIDQVLTNLAVNARDAMPRGGKLEIGTQNRVIDPAYCGLHPEARPGKFVQLSVADSGTGMDAEVLEHLFEPFFTTKEAGKGTGLGLSVAYGIVQSHEGWITVESRPGEGSRFDLYFPALPEVAVLEQPESSGAHRSQTGRGEQILLVEDEPGLQATMVRMLERKGYAVCACQTLSEAQAALFGDPGRFELVLCDVILPDGRGPDFAGQIMDRLPGVAVILMTGYPDDRVDWGPVREAGLLMLQKPIAMHDLLAHVREALEKP